MGREGTGVVSREVVEREREREVERGFRKYVKWVPCIGRSSYWPREIKVRDFYFLSQGKGRRSDIRRIGDFLVSIASHLSVCKFEEEKKHIL